MLVSHHLYSNSLLIKDSLFDCVAGRAGGLTDASVLPELARRGGAGAAGAFSRRLEMSDIDPDPLISCVDCGAMH